MLARFLQGDRARERTTNAINERAQDRAKSALVSFILAPGASRL